MSNRQHSLNDAVRHEINPVKNDCHIFIQLHTKGAQKHENRRKKEADQRLVKSVIEPCHTEEAPLTLLFRQNVNLCFCIDYLKLTAVVHKDSYLIPGTD